MKDSHVTLRLPGALARTLARWAKQHGVAKSQVVREAVAAYLRTGPTAVSRTVTAADLAEQWRDLPRLTPDEAAAFSADLAEARDALPPPDQWD